MLPHWPFMLTRGVEFSTYVTNSQADSYVLYRNHAPTRGRPQRPRCMLYHAGYIVCDDRDDLLQRIEKIVQPADSTSDSTSETALPAE